MPTPTPPTYASTMRPSAVGPLADDIDREIGALSELTVAPIRAIRERYSTVLREHPAADVLTVAMALRDRRRWVAYELVYHHADALAALDVTSVEDLGTGMQGWEEVDAFGRYVSGPAWQRRLIADEVVHRWAASPDLWWRRAALVSTVPLNLRAAGGTGDAPRTLDICTRLVDDRDDMVVKALSWALRALVVWDRDAVARFLAENDARVAARVRREVTTMLRTGRKAKPRT
jgi:3-methyladenine DNA glycosylase AlkD